MKKDMEKLSNELSEQDLLEILRIKRDYLNDMIAKLEISGDAEKSKPATPTQRKIGRPKIKGSRGRPRKKTEE